MLSTLIPVGILYIALLIGISLTQRRRNVSAHRYLLAGGNLGVFLGLFTFAATLFSTFTLLGMPDFFRTHGVGAWIFLAISDAAMVFGIIWLGYRFRKKALGGGKYWGMAGFMRDCYQSRLAGLVTFLGAFVFLIPYVAIQIRGVAIFLDRAFPEALPIWAWSLGMVGIMLLYSELGGLKAIIYSDALQGAILLTVIWIVGLRCLDDIGGLTAAFRQLEGEQAALLSTPGPQGLFSFQFLLGSAVAIILIPYTQPQVSTRLAIMRSDRAMYRMAVGLGAFAILIILPTLFIGLYGALRYPNASTSAFLGGALLTDQPAVLAALVLIGLIAAAISTADSQIFALGGELRSILSGEDRRLLRIARVGIGIFAVMALVFAVFSSDQLVLLARISFTGTALMAPMIFTGIFFNGASTLKWLPLATLAGILVFLGAQFGIFPKIILGIQADLLLLILLGMITGGGVLVSSRLSPAGRRGGVVSTQPSAEQTDQNEV